MNSDTGGVSSTPLREILHVDVVETKACVKKLRWMCEARMERREREGEAWDEKRGVRAQAAIERLRSSFKVCTLSVSIQLRCRP
jgi:hypothetical protein